MSVTSPFKFLDAYSKEDKDIFFGRDDEVENLYELVFQSNMTLVYGQSGTGKTSLVQCGLANRFSAAHWFDIHIRRNEDMNASLLRALNSYEIKERSSGSLRERLMKKRQNVKRIKATVEEHENQIIRRLRLLYKHYLKPIYLILDQFEELFILGNEVEQEKFYRNIADILETENYCRVIIIMREESIAQLYDFEKIVPFLFEKRLRVEPMGRSQAEAVIQQTTANFDIALENETIPGQIIDVLSEGQGRVELTYLQVFLDRLYQEASPNADSGIVFTSELIQRIGSVEDILGDFLTRQTASLQQLVDNKYPGISSSAVRKVLSTFVTLEGTKRPLAKDSLAVGKLRHEQIEFIIEQLEKNRILRYSNELYELSHDTLARHIAGERTADEIALLQIAKIVKDRFIVYDTTKTLLNNNEIQLINSFRKQLEEEGSLKSQEWAFVKRSASVNRRRRLALITTVLVIIASLTALTFYSNRQSQIASRNEKLAEDRLTALQTAQEEQKAANYEKYLSDGIALMRASDYSAAIQAFQIALDFDSLRREAADSLLVARQLGDASIRFLQLIREGDDFYNRNDNALFVDALRKYQEALSLNVNNLLAQGKIDATKGKLVAAFEKFKADGDAFFQAGNKPGYRMALENYRQAARIRPNDGYIQRRIREARAGLQ